MYELEPRAALYRREGEGDDGILNRPIVWIPCLHEAARRIAFNDLSCYIVSPQPVTAADAGIILRRLSRPLRHDFGIGQRLPDAFGRSVDEIGLFDAEQSASFGKDR